MFHMHAIQCSVTRAAIMSEDRLMPEYDRPAACCRRVIIRPGAHGRGGEVGWGGVGCMRDVRSQQSQRFKLFPMNYQMHDVRTLL